MEGDDLLPGNSPSALSSLYESSLFPFAHEEENQVQAILSSSSHNSGENGMNNKQLLPSPELIAEDFWLALDPSSTYFPPGGPLLFSAPFTFPPIALSPLSLPPGLSENTSQSVNTQHKTEIKGESGRGKANGAGRGLGRGRGRGKEANPSGQGPLRVRNHSDPTLQPVVKMDLFSLIGGNKQGNTSLSKPAINPSTAVPSGWMSPSFTLCCCSMITTSLCHTLSAHHTTSPSSLFVVLNQIVSQTRPTKK
eukprot:TRINITY_DN5948_c0_g1_i1.p2 TRINITY_DN5948_c0_g1~~TRINITY_DN5948_c0_g1_i1.p2  ORF type:complete len:251 (-),score=76.93 TRINITY_DN5948_c0_g1_i1:1582-2334(-)